MSAPYGRSGPGHSNLGPCTRLHREDGEGLCVRGGENAAAGNPLRSRPPLRMTFEESPTAAIRASLCAVDRCGGRPPTCSSWPGAAHVALRSEIHPPIGQDPSRFKEHRSMRKTGRFVAVALLGISMLALQAAPSLASSHREAPFVAAQPQLDSTDLYAFVSPDKADTVTLISNWIPFEEPAGGPNFYSFATHTHYDINIDNNGDARPD